MMTMIMAIQRYIGDNDSDDDVVVVDDDVDVDDYDASDNRIVESVADGNEDIDVVDDDDDDAVCQ